MKAAVDRIEGGVAVLIPCDDSGTIIRLPHFLLPEAGEGDIVDLIITRDEAGTAAAREKSRYLVAKLNNKSAQ
jgi:hypothetical protein